MSRAQREVSDELLWYAARGYWRFAYRDPFDGARKFLNCVPERFAVAGIPLPSADAVRKRTKAAEELCKKLRATFFAALRHAEPAAFNAAAPTLAEAVDAYFDLYDRQTPNYRASLRRLFDEFAKTVGGAKGVDAVTDADLKSFERRLVARDLSNASVRSYLAQVGMLLNFASKKGWMKADPRATYKKPREELRDPNPFTDEELAAFFAFVRRPARYRPAGWEAMEWAGIGLLTLGLRAVELQRARWENVDWQERFLFVDESHGNKLAQARQWQPIPQAAWPHFLARRQASGLLWTAHHGAEITDGSLARMRRTLQAALPGFAWKRFRKTYATILHHAGNEDLVVSRLLRHSAGGKAVSVAQRHYVGRSASLLRDVVDEAFTPYAATITGGVASAGETQTVEQGTNGMSVASP